jgi:Putative stress-induced transcription regulator
VYADKQRSPRSYGNLWDVAADNLRLIQDLANAWSAAPDSDPLGTPTGAAIWLVAAGLLAPGTPLGGRDHRAILGLRDALREVLSAYADNRDDAEAADHLTYALSPGRATLTVHGDGSVELVSAGRDPYPRIAAAIASAIAAAAIAGTWPRR